MTKLLLLFRRKPLLRQRLRQGKAVATKLCAFQPKLRGICRAGVNGQAFNILQVLGKNTTIGVGGKVALSEGYS